MFHRGRRFIGVAVVLAAAGAARGHDSGDSGDFESQVAVKAALTLARAADANESGDVTGSEWSAFVASLHPDAAGVISADAIIAVLPVPPHETAAPTGGSAFADFVTLLYDRDGDGKIQTWDLASLFALLDTNGDGSVSVVEFAAAQGGLTTDQDAKALAALLAHAADADKSGDVTSFEWGFFLGSLDPDGDGVIDPNSLVAVLHLAPLQKKWWSHHDDDDDDDDEHGDDDDECDDDDGDDDHAPSSSQLSLLVLRLFDRDFDGRIGTDDLNAFFALIDTNGDGALSADEIAAAGEGPDQALEDSTRMALLLARAADADDSGNVTAGEWSAFLASLNPDPDGVVDFLTLVAALPTTEQKSESEDFDPVQSVQRIIKALDRDQDGKITTGDLDALFALLDTDGDGAISAAEFAGAGGGSQEAQDARRLATLLARAADADKSGDVTAGEWTAFLASLNPDANGVIDFMTLVAALPATLAKSEPDPAEVVERLLAALDRDGDGQITTGDLDALFALLDTDGDGALSSAELVPPKALRMLRAPSAGLLVRGADADRDGRATPSEIAAFFGGLGSDRATGAVDMRDLASNLPAAAARRKQRLVRLFDVDRDGVVTLADLHTIFSATDLDHDGTIARAELRRARSRAR
jgi:Ca2+-binding EF-hand superfamily protein